MSDRNQNLVSPNVRYRNLRCSTQNKNLSDRKLPGLAWSIFLSDRMSDKFKKFLSSLIMYTIEKLIKCTFRWQFCFSSSINSFKVMNKNVPKNCQNIAISVKFHETVKLIVSYTKGDGKSPNIRCNRCISSLVAKRTLVPYILPR